jgi:DNA-binding NarL/FixJ family response regulator
VFLTNLIYPEGKSAPGPAGSSQKRRFAMTSVLIVDDQPSFRCILRQLLTQAGLVVVGEAGDVPEAVLQAQALHPDLAIVDIMLPGCNGFEGTRRLKALQPEMRVIVVSAFGNFAQNFRNAATEAGAEKFVLKDDLELGLVKGWGLP